MEDWQLARGYRFAGIHCGIRANTTKLDLALVVSDTPASAAGVFTQNRVTAAPVQVCRERLPSAKARALVVCSGNANACTGERGLNDARRMAALAANVVGCQADQVLVGSTGVIGLHLPMDRVECGIRAAAGSLHATPTAFEAAARAIWTTDTKLKVCTRLVRCGDSEVRISGFAKGAAMIGPNMATMLAYVLTDAPVPPEHLAPLAHSAADKSFNCISVDGHMSTNDTLLLFANGQGKPLTGPALATFDRAVTDVCAELAQAIIRDAEGASHLVTIHVEGARNDAEARQIAKTIADSALVKTAIFGADPNWGRFVSAAGYSGVEFAESQLSLWLGGTLLYDKGTPQPFDATAASSYLRSNREVSMRLLLTLGTGSCTYWTSDLTYDYVRLNAEYTT